MTALLSRTPSWIAQATSAEAPQKKLCWAEKVPSVSWPSPDADGEPHSETAMAARTPTSA